MGERETCNKMQIKSDLKSRSKGSLFGFINLGMKKDGYDERMSEETSKPLELDNI